MNENVSFRNEALPPWVAAIYGVLFENGLKEITEIKLFATISALASEELSLIDGELNSSNFVPVTDVSGVYGTVKLFVDTAFGYTTLPDTILKFEKYPPGVKCVSRPPIDGFTPSMRWIYTFEPSVVSVLEVPTFCPSMNR
jgi:hypothetical protein